MNLEQSDPQIFDLIRRVREVENDSELREPAYERAAGVRQPLLRRLDSPCELVRVVPGQAHRADSALPPLLERARVALERLDALHREHEPKTRVVELVAHPHLTDAIRVLRECPPKLCLLSQHPLAGARVLLLRRVERADLEADAAGLEPRQPVAVEEPFVAVAQDEVAELPFLAREDELEQQVVVSVDDHEAEPRVRGRLLSEGSPRVGLACPRSAVRAPVPPP